MGKVILRCNDNVCLCGVDPRSARFSFAAEGERYDGYRFFVRDKAGRLVWQECSSGVSQSAICTCLQENEAYLASVQLFWQGEKAAEGELSFETSFFPERSRWIGHPAEKDNVLLVKKTFSIGPSAKHAKLFVCGLGFFNVSVNGKRPDDFYFQPVYTDYGARDLSRNADLRPASGYTVAYHMYDVTPFLKTGGNTVEMRIANGYYDNNEKPYEPYVSYGEKRGIFELRYLDGEREVIVDDLGAQVCYTNKIARLLRGDIVDYGAGYSEFVRAQVKEAPTGEWYQSVVRPDKIQGVFYPQKQWWVGKDLYVDFGCNHSGGIDCVLQGERGRSLTVKFYEVLREDGSPEEKTCAYIEPAADGGVLDMIEQSHRYTLSGKRDKVTPEFNWQCFRYAVFYDAEGIAIEDLRSLFLYADIDFDGKFRSSEGIFGEIFEKTILTFQDNLHCGVISDCPHREKRPYTGDGQIVAEAFLYAADGVPLYTKWLEDILHSQLEDGYVPNTAPYSGGGGGYAWGNAVCIVPQVLYHFTGDLTFIKRSYPHIVKWIGFLSDHAEGYIVTKRYKNWDLGDWLAPVTTEFNIPYMRTLCYKKAVDVACEFAQILGTNEESARWKELSAKIARAAFEKFYDRQKNCMCRDLQGETALGLYFGIIPPPYEAAARRRVLERYGGDRHFDTGIVATPLLLEYLMNAGMQDIAFDMMTATGFPSYKKMLEGETTLVESWDKVRTPFHIDDTDYLKPGGKPNSHCHPMFGSVLPWFFKYAAGLNLSRLYRGEVLFTPRYFHRLERAEASKRTVFGQICAAWRKERGGLRIELDIPANLELIARFERGSKGFSAVGEEDSFEVFPDEEGRFRFTLPGGKWTLTELTE